jgi:PAS domain S-box-containing protein
VSESVTASEGYYRLYGLNAGEPVPHHREWLSQLHPDDRPRVVNQIRQVLAGEGTLDLEFRIQRPDGTYRWMLSKGKAIFDSAGRPLRLMGVNIDITSVKQARELARSNEELERFAYAASHDLRDPLRVIQSCAQAIEGRLDEGGRDMVNVIAESARRMIAITDGLLNYALIGGGDVLKRGRVSMNAVFDWAILHLGPAIEEQEASVTRGELPEIDADQPQMIQLMQNLIGNAVKHRSPGRAPEVRVEAGEASGVWRFSVQDNGIGMKPGFERTIFRLFGRLEDRRVAGAGIGLATCRKIVENHGGRIWAESTPGLGSTFFFTLPQ